MANLALIPALAKALIAVAWADGDLHPEEETTLKEVLSLLPPMAAREWSVIELYLVVPILPAERAELIAQACTFIRSAADRARALEAVDAMLHADGLIEPGEEAAAQEARAAFAAVDVSPVAVAGRVIGGLARRRPSREAGLALWQANPIAYYLQALPEAAGQELDRPEVARAALAAGIMAQVVHVAPARHEGVQPALAAALAADWHVSAAEAERIAEAALAVTRRDVDEHRLSRELVALTDEPQRLRLLDTLFTIANTADRVVPAEIDTIRVIASRLQLTHQQFIAAKLKIASADRGGL